MGIITEGFKNCPIVKEVPGAGVIGSIAEGLFDGACLMTPGIGWAVLGAKTGAYMYCCDKSASEALWDTTKSAALGAVGGGLANGFTKAAGEGCEIAAKECVDETVKKSTEIAMREGAERAAGAAAQKTLPQKAGEVLDQTGKILHGVGTAGGRKLHGPLKEAMEKNLPHHDNLSWRVTEGLVKRLDGGFKNTRKLLESHGDKFSKAAAQRRQQIAQQRTTAQSSADEAAGQASATANAASSTASNLANGAQKILRVGADGKATIRGSASSSTRTAATNTTKAQSQVADDATNAAREGAEEAVKKGRVRRTVDFAKRHPVATALGAGVLIGQI